MENIAVYTLTSSLHDEVAVNKVTKEFLESLSVNYDFKGSDYSDYGTNPLSVIYVRTGGTECVLKPMLPQILSATNHPIYLLASGKSNSLAASMEILSYLQQNNISGEILHGSVDYIHTRLETLSRIAAIRRNFSSLRLGIIGKPSDWLISSNTDQNAVREKLGIKLIDVPMEEMMEAYNSVSELQDVSEFKKTQGFHKVSSSLPGALRIYNAIKVIVEKYKLNGFTIRCFDMLSAVHNTGCIALAKFNSEGLIAGCEGDVPAMLSMAITQAITGTSGFQANPARINPETGEMLFAHCTIPFNMLQRYELDTHFESGIGVGIRGYMQEGDVTIFKVSGNLNRYFVAEGKLLRSQAEPGLCRTQQIIQLSNPIDTKYFLTNPIGNHHIILQGHNKSLIDELMKG